MSFDQINDDGAAEQPRLCANNCGFYGNATTMNLCSKCYKAMITSMAFQQRLHPETTSSSEPNTCETTTLLSPTKTNDVSSSNIPERVTGEAKAKAKRCQSCNRKVGLANAFVCKCGITFCGTHRYPEKHGCEFDFKTLQREAIVKANPVIKADKVTRF